MARACAEARQSYLGLLAQVSKPPVTVLDPEREFFKDWTRQQLKEYLTSRTGGRKNYGKYSTDRLIDRLLEVELGRKRERAVRKGRTAGQAKPPSEQVFVRSKPRKASHPSHLPCRTVRDDHRTCGNAACRARISTADSFCRRCSCCICHKFDDNKDPSLWIECCGEAVGEQASCGSSCHIECALDVKTGGVVQRDGVVQLDGSYSCPLCGYTSSLLRCWRKQLVIAREARRADALVFRLKLAARLFHGTSRFKSLQEIVTRALAALKLDLGPPSASSSKTARGLVNRLSCAARVHSLLDEAIGMGSSWPFQREKQQPFTFRGGCIERAYKFQINEITSNSVVASWTGSANVLGERVLGHSIWCRPSSATRFLSRPTCCLPGEDSIVRITGLQDGVEYVFQLVPFTVAGEVGQVEVRCYTLKASGSGELAPVVDLHRMLERGEVESAFRMRDIAKFLMDQAAAEAVKEEKLEEPLKSLTRTQSPPDCSMTSCMDFTTSSLKRCSSGEEAECNERRPVQPVGEVVQRKRPKLMEEEDKQEEEVYWQRSFNFSVRVIVWLERQGYLKPRFRLKLLSWLGFQATEAEKKLVFVYISTLLGDPVSLALQLVDTFQEVLWLRQQRDTSNKENPA